MKKIIYVSLFAFIGLSCSDDDDEGVIKGTWIPVKEVTKCADVSDDIVYEYDENGCYMDVCFKMVFAEDSLTSISYTNAVDEFPITLDYSISGSTLTIFDGSEDHVYSYKIKGKTLTLNQINETFCVLKTGTYSRVGSPFNSM